jgi:geranylgeranylglycerol-phosphate geranylgeranyltransferase
MNHYLEIIRPGTSLLAALGAVAGAAISGLPFSVFYLYILLTVFLISGAGMVINDYYDIEIDRINAPQRPLPSGRISKENAFLYSIILFTSGILISTPLGTYCFLLALLNSILEFFYARNLKKRFLVGNILVSYFTASTFLFGALVTFDFKVIWIISLLAFLANMGREIYKAIEDIRGDKKMRLDTLPIAAGIKSAKEIAQGFIASAVILSPLPYLSGLLTSTYMKIVSISNVLFLYSFSQAPSKSKIITKIAMFLVLAACLLGA